MLGKDPCDEHKYAEKLSEKAGDPVIDVRGQEHNPEPFIPGHVTAEHCRVKVLFFLMHGVK